MLSTADEGGPNQRTVRLAERKKSGQRIRSGPLVLVDVITKPTPHNRVGDSLYLDKDKRLLKVKLNTESDWDMLSVLALELVLNPIYSLSIMIINSFGRTRIGIPCTHLLTTSIYPANPPRLQSPSFDLLA